MGRDYPLVFTPLSDSVLFIVLAVLMHRFRRLIANEGDLQLGGAALSLCFAALASVL